MSRKGNRAITLPKNVKINYLNNNILIEGPLGKFDYKIHDSIELHIEENIINVKRKDNEKFSRGQHGLVRTLISNMIQGVSEGFVIKQEIVGVGYKATCTNNVLELSLGYSHNIVFPLPKNISVECITEKGKNPLIITKSHDNQLLGQFVSKIRSLRKPEPFKGKGIKFVNEEIRRKAGKSLNAK